MHEEYSSQYSESPFDEDNDDATKLLGCGITSPPQLLGSGITSPPLKHRFLHLWPWLSHSVLMSITLVFFVLWARAPSMDNVVLFCRWIITRFSAQDLTYPSQLQHLRLLNPSAS